MELSSPKIKKNILYFSKKYFLYFRKWNPQKTCYILGGNFPSLKTKKNLPSKNFLYFGKRKFLVSSLKKNLYFRKEF